MASRLIFIIPPLPQTDAGNKFCKLFHVFTTSHYSTKTPFCQGFVNTPVVYTQCTTQMVKLGFNHKGGTYVKFKIMRTRKDRILSAV